MDGDEVAVELVDVDEMLEEKQSKVQARYTRRLSSISNTLSSSVTSSIGLSSIPEEQKTLLDQDKFILSSNEKPRPQYCGRIVCILERPKNMLFSG